MYTQDFNCFNCKEKFHTNICLCSCSLCHEQFCKECMSFKNLEKTDYIEDIKITHLGDCKPKCFECKTPSVGICSKCLSKCHVCRKPVEMDRLCSDCLKKRNKPRLK